jgi:predicted small secreted protein
LPFGAEKEVIMTRYIAMFAALLGLAACETAGGLGQDVENAGEGIQQGAENIEDAM